MNKNVLLELAKLEFVDEIDNFIVEYIGNKDIFNPETMTELHNITITSSNFYLKNKISKIPLYQHLAELAEAGELSKIEEIVANNTIDCKIANKIGEIAARGNHFKVLTYLIEEGIDLNHNNNVFLEKAAEFKHSGTISYILNEFDKSCKRPVFNAPIHYADGEEMMELDLDALEDRPQKFEIYDPTAMDVLFENKNLFKNLIKNNMIHDLQKIQDYKYEYKNYMEDNINYAELIQYSAKQNIFNVFNYFIQNGTDPYFNENQLLKNDMAFIKDIAVMFYKYDNLQDALKQECTHGTTHLVNYLVKNRNFLNILNETIYLGLEAAAEHGHHYICKKIIAEGFDEYKGNSIKAKRFLNQLKGNIECPQENQSFNPHSTKIVI